MAAPNHASDALALERIMLATPGGPNVRWSDSQLLSLTSRGVKDLVADVLFPESILVATTQPGVQGYILPDMHVVHRVYAAGQVIVPTPGGFETWQGDQIMVYDQRGSSGNGAQNTAAALSSGTFQPFGGFVPSGGTSPGGSGTSAAPGSIPPAGSAAAPGSGGVMQPAWTQQTPVSYPYLNSWGTPAPEAQPWSAGQRPRYAIEGGVLYLQPIPSTAVDLTVIGVCVPDDIKEPTDALVIPDNFLDGVVSYVMWKAASANAMSDRSPAAAANRSDALNEYEREKRKLRTWKRQYTMESAQSFVLTYRGAFRIGGHRTGTWG